MPRYDFKCSVCSSQVELERSIGDEKYPICCNVSMERLWSAPAAIFNGSGFYSTDNRKQGYNSIMVNILKDHPSVKLKEWKLNANDRCDRCQSQAYVKIAGSTGELLFCSHHYNKIVDDVSGYTKMMAFMYAVVDERERLEENKTIGAI